MTTFALHSSSFPLTEDGAIERWLDGAMFSDGWNRSMRVVTRKGAYIITAQPLFVDDKPVTFDETAK